MLVFPFPLCLLCLAQSVCHGFPANSTAVGYDEEVNLLAIGTKHGELIVYPGQNSLHCMQLCCISVCQASFCIHTQ